MACAATCFCGSCLIKVRMFYPRNSTPWAKELPSSTSHSNRSLRTEVFVAGKRNFQRGDKEAETTLEIQRRRCRDKITLGNSANSGLIARLGVSGPAAPLRDSPEISCRALGIIARVDELVGRSAATQWDARFSWASAEDEQTLLRAAVDAIPKVAEIVCGFSPEDQAGALEAAERRFMGAPREYVL